MSAVGDARGQEAARRRLENRWRHALRLWRAYLEGPELPPLDRWLAVEMKRWRGFGSRDRHWYREVLFAALRFGSLATFMERWWPRLADTEPRGDGLRESFRQELSRYEAELADPRAALEAWRGAQLASWFDWIVRRLGGPGALGPSLLALCDAAEGRRREQSWARIAEALGDVPELSAQLLWHGIPLAYRPFLERRAARSGWGAPQLREFLRLQDRQPPVWLRLNAPERAERVVEELRARGFSVIQRRDDALAVEGCGSLYATEAYQQGWFELQDLASQHLGRQVALRPGEIAWDCCAGAGGKTLQLACAPSGLARRGALYASDPDREKLAELRRRARRAGVSNVRVLPWNGRELPRFGPEVERRGGFDWVLVDAPCSSSGTWRRRPDDRFRFRLDRLRAVADRQRHLLGLASRTLRPAGGLVYGTCSWLVEENEEVVEAFLREQPAFELVRMELFGAPDDDADTTFAAVLRKGGRES